MWRIYTETSWNLVAPGKTSVKTLVRGVIAQRSLKGVQLRSTSKTHFDAIISQQVCKNHADICTSGHAGETSGHADMRLYCTETGTETPESESSPKLSREHVPSHFLIRADRILPSDVIDICCWGGGVFFLKFLLFW